MLAAPGAIADGTNAPARPDYSSFRIIAERNIFNAKRSGGTVRARDSRPAARVEAFALVGTLIYEKGPTAFFDSNSSEFKKALRPGDTIAGYTVARVDPSGVALKVGETQVELKVGGQMRREDGGEWHASASTELPAASTAGSDSSTESDSAPAGDVSDVLKRLMQQRDKE